MWAAKNGLLVPASAAAPTPPTFDAATASILGFTNLTGSPATETSAGFTASSGAGILLAFLHNNTTAPTNVKYNNQAMTPVDNIGTNNSTTGHGYLFYLPAGGTGSSHTFTATVPAYTWAMGAAASYNNVTGLGTVTKTYGSSTTASTGSITCPADQMILAFLFAGYSDNKYINTASGGNARTLGNAGASPAISLALRDANATTTFTGGITGGATAWATISVVIQ